MGLFAPKVPPSPYGGFLPHPPGRPGWFSGFFQTAQHGGRLFKVLNAIQNTRKILKTVETVSPLVQQIAPIAKNVPEIFKLVQEFQQYSKTKENHEAHAANSHEEDEIQKESKESDERKGVADGQEIQENRGDERTKKKKKALPKRSAPRLYL